MPSMYKTPKPKNNKKRLQVPMEKSQKEKNCLYESLDTPESKKCIKKEKSIDIEKIFVKKNKNKK